MKNKLNTCKECASDYFRDKSEMKSLCPDCAHHLYGIKNCGHHFVDGRCKHCHWNGITSGYIKMLRK